MATPAFVDVGYAADMLHVSADTIRDWIADGKLRTFGGRADNPFIRYPDVVALAAEAGVQAQGGEAPRRVKSASARVQVRLTADSKWGDISEDDIRDWARRSDRARRVAARTAAGVARQRLDMVLRALDEVADLP